MEVKMAYRGFNFSAFKSECRGLAKKRLLNPCVSGAEESEKLYLKYGGKVYVTTKNN